MSPADRIGKQGMKTSPSKRFLAKQAEIVRQVTKTLNQSGVKGMALTDIASSLGMAPTSMAYYFNTKEALAAACFRKSIEKFKGLTDEALVESTQHGRLARLVRSYFQLLYDIATETADDIAQFDDLLALDEASVEADYVDLFRKLRLIFDRADQSLETRTLVNIKTHLLLQLLQSVKGWMENYHPSSYARAGERMLDILLYGISSDQRTFFPLALDTPMADDAAQPDPRDVFLRVATRLISAHGYRGASVERIVAELNMTRGAFYHHIDLKDDLIETCFVRSSETVRTTLDAGLKLNADSRDRLTAILAHILDRQLYGDAPLLRYAVTSVPDSVMQTIRRLYGRNDMEIASLLSEGIRDGSIRAIDVHMAANIVSCTINAAVELGNWLPRPFNNRTVELYLSSLFEGFQKGTV